MISPSQRLLPHNTQHSQHTNIQALGGIRTHDRSRRAAEDLCLRPRGHWDRPSTCVRPLILKTRFHTHNNSGNYSSSANWPYAVVALKPRLYWSQNRHNTANQHLSGHTSPDMCGYFHSDKSVQTSSYKRTPCSQSACCEAI